MKVCFSNIFVYVSWMYGMYVQAEYTKQYMHL